MIEYTTQIMKKIAKHDARLAALKADLVFLVVKVEELKERVAELENKRDNSSARQVPAVSSKRTRKPKAADTPRTDTGS